MMIIIFWEMTPCGSFPEDDNHHIHRRGNLKSFILNEFAGFIKKYNRILAYN
jgi:hypothetical protein